MILEGWKNEQTNTKINPPQIPTNNQKEDKSSVACGSPEHTSHKSSNWALEQLDPKLLVPRTTKPYIFLLKICSILYLLTLNRQLIHRRMESLHKKQNKTNNKSRCFCNWQGMGYWVYWSVSVFSILALDNHLERLKRLLFNWISLYLTTYYVFFTKVFW